MRKSALICVLFALAPLPVAAEEDDKSLMEQGAELFFEGLRQEMEPSLNTLRELALQFGPAMQSFVDNMGPALAELMAQVDDWSAYEAPEILPNGDIIIRKKPTPPPQEESGEEPEPPSEGTDI